MRIPFLTAGWSDVCIVSYAVPEQLVRHNVPPGLDADTREGLAFASLVGLTFVDTKVLGIAWPGFRIFPELNLRIYVRHGNERGVLFVGELVPSPVVAWLARTLYNEPYEAAPLVVHTRDDETTVSAEYLLEHGGTTHHISMVGEKPPVIPAEDSQEHFFKEHRWGFGRSPDRRLLRYEVEHPVWAVYPVKSFELSLDWGKVYGKEWEFLAYAKPASTIFAVGSRIAVFPATNQLIG